MRYNKSRQASQEAPLNKKSWKLQDAKNHFSELVYYAMTEGPQEVTKRGEKAVVIVSYETYKCLVEPKESLVNFLLKSPLKNSHLDLKRSKDIPREMDL